MQCAHQKLGRDSPKFRDGQNAIPARYWRILLAQEKMSAEDETTEKFLVDLEMLRNESNSRR